jgi:prepilin-type N-terminal cleavage/methylation domain-containing protein
VKKFHLDDGLSLIELMISVAILGIAFVAVLGGMTSSIFASDVHRKQSDVTTILRSYAESIKAAAYSECATTYSPSFSGLTGTTYTAADGIRFTIPATTVLHWNGNTGTPTFVAAGSIGSCASSPASDNGLQQVTITVSSVDARASQTIKIAKRRP